MTSLKEDVKCIFNGLFGPEVAKQVDSFEKPDMYPKDFLDQSVYFLGKFIGDAAARKRLEPLYEKYVTEDKSEEKRPAKRRPE
jgi:hypothetical protein